MSNTVYILDNGYMELDKNQMLSFATLATVKNKNAAAEWIKIPVYCVLIHNSQLGWILFDTGCHPDGMKGYWSEGSTIVAPYYLTEDQLLVNQLAKVGLKPEDIGTVVLSHMHCDHAGGLFLFKYTADVYVGRAEYMNALFVVHATPNIDAHGPYCIKDITTPVQKFHFSTQDFELAPGVDVIHLPGHVPDLLGLVVHTDSGSLIFPSDALNLMENYGPPTRIPTSVFDNRATLDSIDKIRNIQRKYKANLFFSHDMDFFKTLKLAPECYK